MWEITSDYNSFIKEREDAAQQNFLNENNTPLNELNDTELFGIDIDQCMSLIDGIEYEFDLSIQLSQKEKVLSFSSLGDHPNDCSARHNQINAEAIRFIRSEMIPRLNRLAAWGMTRDNRSRDTTEMIRLAEDYNNNKKFRYVRCVISGYRVENIVRSELRLAYNEAVRMKDRGMRIVWDNAIRELGVLRDIRLNVEDSRRDFETRDDGQPGISGIASFHNNFIRQQVVCDTFTLTKYLFADDRMEDPDLFASRIASEIQSEARSSAITNLDRLRDEYVERGRLTPRPSEFTQSRSSQNFSFSELRAAAYSWAMITQGLLNRLEAARASVGGPMLIVSGYRNPAHNDSVGGVSNSRHQYGDAADVNPKDYNNDGVVDGDDKKILADSAHEAGFNEVISKPNITVHMAHE